MGLLDEECIVQYRVWYDESSCRNGLDNRD